MEAVPDYSTLESNHQGSPPSEGLIAYNAEHEIPETAPSNLLEHHKPVES
jgi:hypothetical protein